MRTINSKDYDRRFPTGWTEQVMLGADRFAGEIREANAYNHNGQSTVGYAVAEFHMRLRDLAFHEDDLIAAIELSLKTLREVKRK